MTPPPGLPSARTIRVKDAAADPPGLADPETFHANWGREPLLLQGLLPQSHPLRRLGVEELAELLGDSPLRAYPSGSGDAVWVPAREVLAHFRAGSARYNVVDHGLAGSPLGAWVEPPAFLGTNWFEGVPFRLDRYLKSLVLSPAGAFTPLHLDSYAMLGWMVLLEGRKRWRLHPPAELSFLFDRATGEFFDPRRHDPCRYPGLAECVPVEGTIGPGDFLYFPAGWVHQVETLEPSLGVGGCVLNDHQIEEHMRGWLWECSVGRAPADLDLAAALQALTPERFSRPRGRERTAAALALWAAAGVPGSPLGALPFR